MNITECRITRHAVQCTPVCSVLHGITTDTKPPVLIWLCNNPWINLSSYVSSGGGGDEWVMGCWCGYLSGVRCRLVYGPSWCHCHSLSLASAKSRLVLPFWYRLTRVVPEKGPLNRCVWGGEGVVAQERGHRTASPKTFYAEKTRSDYDCLLNESKVAYRNKVWLFWLLLFVYALA